MTLCSTSLTRERVGFTDVCVCVLRGVQLNPVRARPRLAPPMASSRTIPMAPCPALLLSTPPGVPVDPCPSSRRPWRRHRAARAGRSRLLSSTLVAASTPIPSLPPRRPYPSWVADPREAQDLASPRRPALRAVLPHPQPRPPAPDPWPSILATARKRPLAASSLRPRPRRLAPAARGSSRRSCPGPRSPSGSPRPPGPPRTAVPRRLTLRTATSPPWDPGPRFP